MFYLGQVHYTPLSWGRGNQWRYRGSTWRRLPSCCSCKSLLQPSLALGLVSRTRLFFFFFNQEYGESQRKTINILSQTKVADGRLLRLTHASDACNCNMTFSLFLPPAAETHTVSTRIPIILWLQNLKEKWGEFLTFRCLYIFPCNSAF